MSQLSEGERLVLRRALEILGSGTSADADADTQPAGAASRRSTGSTPSASGAPAASRRISATGAEQGQRQSECMQPISSCQSPRLMIPAGFDDVCSTALSSLRGTRKEDLCRTRGTREEQASLFRKRKYSSMAAAASPASWTQKFICLHNTTADWVPTTQSEKLMLEEAGLGEKKVTIPDLDCSQSTFHQPLLEAYPKLDDGGGFELLRCKPQTRDLVLIRSPNCQYTKVRSIVGQKYI